MKFQLVNKDIHEDYVVELLKERGVENPEAFLNNPESLYHPENYILDNVDKGIDLLKKSIEEVNNNNRKILLVVDSDCDGFTSSAIIYYYLSNFVDKSNLLYTLHAGKQHGLEDKIEEILDSDEDICLVICPDSSSNDYQYHEQLREVNIPVLVLDHHLADPPFSSNAVIINNQLSPSYGNKALTGAGVTWKFCMEMDKTLERPEGANDLIDLAALGIVGDMGNMTDIENRVLVDRGLYSITNYFFERIVMAQAHPMKNKINPTTIAFYIVPLINAMIRMGTIEEKIKLFEAFVDGHKKVLTSKRGHAGELEEVAVDSVRECTNARTRQNTARDKAIEQLDFKIQKLDLLQNKVLFIPLEEDDKFPPELNGLIAIQLANRYKRPTIIARLNDQGFYRGSARGIDNSGLDSFKEFCTSSKLFEYAEGHAQAFGISIPQKNLDKFHEYANRELADYDFNTNIYNVNFVRNINIDSDLEKLVIELSDYEYLWGEGNKEPKIAITDINLRPTDIQIIGQYQNVLKFNKNGVEFVKFFAKDLIANLPDYKDIKATVIGKAAINEWNGIETPQIIIDDIEFRNGELEF